jgi:hypothetical protein
VFLIQNRVNQNRIDRTLTDLLEINSENKYRFSDVALARWVIYLEQKKISYSKGNIKHWIDKLHNRTTIEQIEAIHKSIEKKWKDIYLTPIGDSKYHKLLGKSNYHPASFTLAKELWQRLTRPAAYYKDRHFIHFNKDEVAKIEIRYKDKHLVAKRQGKNWTIKPEGMAEVYELDFLLGDLNDLKYLPEKKIPPPFTSALAEVKLWNKNNQLILNLLYFKEKEETWIKKDKKYYPVKETVWDSFPEKLKEEKDG